MKLELWLPISAIAKFTTDIDTENNTEDEVVEKFINESVSSFLCHSCGKDIQSDVQMLDTDDLSNKIKEQIRYLKDQA